MDIFSTRGVSFPNGQPVVTGNSALRTDRLLTSNPKHIQPGRPSADPSENGVGFADVLNQALGSVEQLDQQSQELTQKAVYDPDSVEAHTLMIAAERARFALNLTKTLADGAVRTFRDLTNPR